MFVLSDDKLQLLLRIPSILSIIGTSCVILTFYRFPRLRNYRHVELAVYVAINDFFAAVELVLGSLNSTDPACWFQGIGSSYNFLSSVLWSSVISYQIFVIVNQGTVIEDLKWFHVFCWGFPLLPTLLPLTTNNYGAVHNSWCFLVDRSDSPAHSIFAWEILSFFLWLWLTMLFNSVVFVFILRRIRDLATVESMNAYRPLFRLAFCPVVLVLCWAVPTFLVVFEVATNHSYVGVGVSVLESFALLLPPLQGFLMSIAFFVVNESARLEWKLYWKLLPLTAKQRQEVLSANDVFGSLYRSSNPGSSSNVEEPRRTQQSVFSMESNTTSGTADHWAISTTSSSKNSFGSQGGVRNSVTTRIQTSLLNDNSAF